MAHGREATANLDEIPPFLESRVRPLLPFLFQWIRRCPDLDVHAFGRRRRGTRRGRRRRPGRQTPFPKRSRARRPGLALRCRRAEPHHSEDLAGRRGLDACRPPGRGRERRRTGRSGALQPPIRGCGRPYGYRLRRGLPESFGPRHHAERDRIDARWTGGRAGIEGRNGWRSAFPQSLRGRRRSGRQGVGRGLRQRLDSDDRSGRPRDDARRSGVRTRFRRWGWKRRAVQPPDGHRIRAVG